MIDAVLGGLALVQGGTLAVLTARLAGGRTRRPPEMPRLEGLPEPGLTIVIACLNEAQRIGPCLRGVQGQGAPVREILVIDSGSTDGTRELVEAAVRQDPRIRLLTDPPLPTGWIGKAWALQHGLTQASHPWVLGLDADTEAAPGAAAAILHAAQRERFDVVSFSPRFDGQGVAERFVQPALLISLLYRTGAAGDPRVRPDRILANGQCFLARREVLLHHGGYEPVRESFAEDVSLVRHLATRGVAVGFLDGSRLYRVRSYATVGQMWREWGRSIDLKDAASRAQQWRDVLIVVCAQGLALPVAIALWACWPALPASPARDLVAGFTAAILAIRLLLQVALRGSYQRRGLSWWLSPLADPLAAVRMVVSSVRRPRRWRTRTYDIA